MCAYACTTRWTEPSLLAHQFSLINSHLHEVQAVLCGTIPDQLNPCLVVVNLALLCCSRKGLVNNPPIDDSLLLHADCTHIPKLGSFSLARSRCISLRRVTIAPLKQLSAMITNFLLRLSVLPRT